MTQQHILLQAKDPGNFTGLWFFMAQFQIMIQPYRTLHRSSSQQGHKAQREAKTKKKSYIVKKAHLKKLFKIENDTFSFGKRTFLDVKNLISFSI